MDVVHERVSAGYIGVGMESVVKKDWGYIKSHFELYEILIFVTLIVLLAICVAASPLMQMPSFIAVPGATPAA